MTRFVRRYFQVSVRSPLIQCTRPTHPKVNSNSLLILWQSAYEQIPTVDLRSISVQNTQTQKTTATRYWFCGSVPMSIRRLWFFVFYGRRELFYFGEVILILTGQTCLTEKLFWWLAQSTTCFTRYYNNGNSWRTQYTDDVQQTWMSTATHH